MMSLSEKTIQKLGDALMNDVVTYMNEDDRFFELMVELLPDAIHAKLGYVDSMVTQQLSMYLSAHIYLAGE